MPDQLQLRGGTTTEHNSFTGAAREVTVDTTKKTLVVHDGSQAGGTPLMKESGTVDSTSLQFGTGGTQRLAISSSEVVFNESGANTDFRVEGDSSTHLLFLDAGNDRVGIKASSPATPLHVGGTIHTTTNLAIRVTSSTNNLHVHQDDSDKSIAQFTNTVTGTGAGDGFQIGITSGEDALLNMKESKSILFKTADLERAQIDSSGRLLIGTSTNTFTGVGSSRLQISGTGADTAGAALIRTSNDGGGAYLQFIKNRGSATQSGDNCGAIAWLGHDGTDVESYLAQIRVVAGATATSNSMTGDITFETANGSSIPTERMRLDSAGRLLIGTTTEGNESGDELTINSSGNTGITLRTGSNANGSILFSDGTSGTAEYAGAVQYLHASDELILGANTVSVVKVHDEHFNIFAPEGTIRMNFGFTNTLGGELSIYDDGGNQKTRITGSVNTNHFFNNGGNLGVGLNNPSFKVDILENGADALRLGNSDATAHGSHDCKIVAGTAVYNNFDFQASTYKFQTYNGTSLGERLRIQSDGTIRFQNYGTLFGNTGLSINNTGSGGPQLLVSRESNDPLLLNRNGTDGTIVEFRKGWSAGGSVSVGTNSATYNTSSDYRLKENIVPISDGITRLKTLKPSRFNWIGDTDSTRDGFIAHEVTAVPEAITGTKDEVYTEDQPSLNIKAGDPKYQGIDQSKLVPLLVAAVQELIGRVETLEAA